AAPTDNVDASDVSTVPPVNISACAGIAGNSAQVSADAAFPPPGHRLVIGAPPGVVHRRPVPTVPVPVCFQQVAALPLCHRNTNRPSYREKPPCRLPEERLFLDLHAPSRHAGSGNTPPESGYRSTAPRSQTGLCRSRPAPPHLHASMQ